LVGRKGVTRSRRVRELWRGIIDLALPPLCASCRAPIRAGSEGLERSPESTALCRPCHDGLPWLPQAGCRLCGGQAVRAVESTRQAAAELEDMELCRSCAAAPRSRLLACVAALSFEGDAERWIYRMKYPGRGLTGLDPGGQLVLRAFARAAARRATGPAPDWIVPVPLHPQRLHERGFNPAALIARELARATGARFEPRALARIRDTPSQTGLGREARRRNVAGAFIVRPGTSSAPPESVWLVDDVVTTRSTLEASAQPLTEFGASRITAVCLAQTPQPDRAQ
jgi:ComF family protein